MGFVQYVLHKLLPGALVPRRAAWRHFSAAIEECLVSFKRSVCTDEQVTRMARAWVGYFPPSHLEPPPVEPITTVTAWSRWLLQHCAVPVIKHVFHITRHESLRGLPVAFRTPCWFNHAAAQLKPVLRRLEGRKCRQSCGDRHIMGSLSLLPKFNGIRPIVNLSARPQLAQRPGQCGPPANAIMRYTHKVRACAGRGTS